MLMLSFAIFMFYCGFTIISGFSAGNILKIVNESFNWYCGMLLFVKGISGKNIKFIDDVGV